MRKVPPLNALKVFDMAAKYQSFSRAAEENCMTKGAISQQIKLLEEWLGVSLFERASQGVRLNKHGLALKNTCDQAFALIEGQCLAMRREKSTLKDINIGCSSSLLSYWFLPKFDHWFKSEERFKVKFNSKASIHELFLGNIDLFISGEDFEVNDTINQELLYKGEAGLVCSKEYLKKLMNNKASEQITILHANSKESAWQEWCQASNISISPASEMEFDKLSLALDAVKLNIGATIAPHFVVEGDIERGILFAPYGFLNCTSGTYLYTRKDLPGATKAWIDEIINKMKSPTEG